MRCPSCGITTKAGFKFCAKCGLPVPGSEFFVNSESFSAWIGRAQIQTATIVQAAAVPQYAPVQVEQPKPVANIVTRQPVADNPAVPAQTESKQEQSVNSGENPEKRPNRQALIGFGCGIALIFFTIIELISASIIVGVFMTILSFTGLSFSIMGIVRKNVKHRGLAITGAVINFLGAGAISVFIIYVCIAAFI